MNEQKNLNNLTGIKINTTKINHKTLKVHFQF